jgi:hypothetical protein
MGNDLVSVRGGQFSEDKYRYYTASLFNVKVVDVLRIRYEIIPDPADFRTYDLWVRRLKNL